MPIHSLNLNLNRAETVVGIVGTGVMGRGIAQIAAQAQCVVLLYDTNESAAENAKKALGEQFQKLADKGKIKPEVARFAAENIKVIHSLNEFAACSVVVEAILENLDIKKRLFAQLEEIVSEHCILATNTSSLSVTSIAAGCKTPERVAGFHFFNPVPLMKVVEVIGGVLTSSEVSTALFEFAKHLGHTPVRAKDTPGFIVNHAGRGYGTEALRVLSEGVATVPQLDAILRDGAGFKMGPFELLDLTGLDVSHPVMESIYHQFYQEPRYRPSPLTALHLSAGLLGRKSGRGFYSYSSGSGTASVAAPASATAASPVLEAASLTNLLSAERVVELKGQFEKRTLWLSSTNPEAAQNIAALAAKIGIAVEHSAKPSGTSLCVVFPLGEDATTAALAEGCNPSCTVALETLTAFNKHRTVMSTPVTTPEICQLALHFFRADGIAATLVSDSAGMVVQRVLATVVNIGCDIAQQRIATPVDIDLAVTLGLGYPQGPLRWGDSLGAPRVLKILENLQKFYGDPRYRPSPWLKRRALLKVSLLTQENVENVENIKNQNCM